MRRAVRPIGELTPASRLLSSPSSCSETFSLSSMPRRTLAHIRNALTGAQLGLPGHYFSPICDPREIGALSGSDNLADIELAEDRQIARWHSWSGFLPATHSQLYTADNRQYRLGDATCLYCFLRELRPSRLIEVGSGYSSACTIDTINAFDLPTRCTFIEPFPERLAGLLERSGS